VGWRRREYLKCPLTSTPKRCETILVTGTSPQSMWDELSVKLEVGIGLVFWFISMVIIGTKMGERRCFYETQGNFLYLFKYKLMDYFSYFTCLHFFK